MPQADFCVSLITPTYNERENVSLLAEEIFGVLSERPDIDLELIIVDDNSPDGTGQVAEALKERFPVKVVHRAGKLGLGSAVMAGFAESDRPLLGVIDADLSHDPSILPELIYGLARHDLAMGSRFGKTSEVEKWAVHRKMISFVGVAFARLITGVEDPLSGYFFLRREVIGSEFTLTSGGYKILLEILVKGNCQSHFSKPFVFRNRQFSASKLNLREHILFAKQIIVFGFHRLFSVRSKRLTK
tara:strand:+ start:499 stop:1230 length:732 start_codon:yes stop_codon:yes gene_type:complete